MDREYFVVIHSPACASTTILFYCQFIVACVHHQVSLYPQIFMAQRLFVVVCLHWSKLRPKPHIFWLLFRHTMLQRMDDGRKVAAGPMAEFVCETENFEVLTFYMPRKPFRDHLDTKKRHTFCLNTHRSCLKGSTTYLSPHSDYDDTDTHFFVYVQTQCQHTHQSSTNSPGPTSTIKNNHRINF